jgi:hypothetical protein
MALVARKQHQQPGNTERLGGYQVHDEIEFCRLLGMSLGRATRPL